MAQLSLDLPLKKKVNFLEEDFCFLPENSQAIKAIKKFFTQDNFEETQINNLTLLGAKFSGKTHILNIFAQKNAKKCHFIDKDNLKNLNLANFFQKNQFYILDDFEQIKDEELLFHLFNASVRSKSFLLLSTEKMPNFKIKDVKSRFKNIVTITISNPSLESTTELLFFTFSQKQLKVPLKLITKIANNIERTYEEIFKIAAEFEKFYNENGNFPKF